MNVKALILFLATGPILTAQPVSATVNPTPPSEPAAPITSDTPTGPIASGDATPPANSTAPGNPVVPSANFAPARYESLWTKSPFAVETLEVSTDTSPDYTMVGIANVDGVSYASLVETKNQEHFLISTDKATRGLTLGKITLGHNGSDTYASVLKDGQTLTLKLEQAPAAAPTPGAPPGVVTGNAPVQPGSIIPNIPMPGANPTLAPGSIRPFTRIHRPTINLPGRSPQQPVPPPPQPAPTPAPAPAPAQ
jgi:hypothetical protein